MKHASPVRDSAPARRASAAPTPRLANPVVQTTEFIPETALVIDGCPCGGGCPRCQRKNNQALRLDWESGAGHDEEHERETPSAPAPLASDGKPAVQSWKELSDLFIDGGGPKTTTPPQPKKPAPTPKPAPGPTSACPTNIKVAGTGNLEMDAGFAEGGILTGFGGFAVMEVSDASGKDWAGTAIHENLKNVKNTCGLAGACSNAQGEGGAKGSTFKVGEASNLLGIMPLPSKKNSFYDQHMIIMQGVSALHKAGKPSCEIQCEQTYDCGGKTFGPTFLISYSLKQATIKGSKKNYDVTTVDMNVAPKP